MSGGDASGCLELLLGSAKRRLIRHTIKRVRICIVYDCLFPHTVGGAELWYRNLALRLAADGHDVNYLTLRQWDRDERADLPGVTVVIAGPRMKLYSAPGHRRILPPLRFGLGVLLHLLRHGRSYEVVHTASFPYFSLLAAGAVRRLHGYRLIVDWHEVWSREYWDEYLGRWLGWIGWMVQAFCLRIRQRAFCFAQLTAKRLGTQGVNGKVAVLHGEYAGPWDTPEPVPAEPLVVFAGRHIPEKAAPAAVAAIASARTAIPELRAVIFGDGPEYAQVVATIRRLRLEDVVHAPGFVPRAELDRILPRALCLLHPSRREGYGVVVVEAAARGVPTILVDHPDNAAVELISDGVNGVVTHSENADELAAAIERVYAAGSAMRASTHRWFIANAGRLSLDASLDAVAAVYGDRS